MTTDWTEAVGEQIIDAHAGLEGPMLPILHAIQEEFGFISEAAMRLVAAKLNVTRAEVYGVVTFYHDFRQEPAGRHVLKICRAEACQSMGGAGPGGGAAGAARDLDWGGTTPEAADRGAGLLPRPVRLRAERDAGWQLHAGWMASGSKSWRRRRYDADLCAARCGCAGGGRG